MGKSNFKRKSSKRKQDDDGAGNGNYIKTELKFAPMTDGKAQKTFAAIKEMAIRSINKDNMDLDDVHNGLRLMVIKDLDPLKPICAISATNDPREEKCNERIFEEKVKGHVDRERILKKGMRLSYLIVLDDWCSTRMKQKIQALPDFETVTRNDPIALL